MCDIPPNLIGQAPIAIAYQISLRRLWLSSLVLVVEAPFPAHLGLLTERCDIKVSPSGLLFHDISRSSLNEA